MRLPVISGKELAKILISICYRLANRKGSHITLIRQGSYPPVTVPLHSELKRGTLMSILARANLSRTEFLELHGHGKMGHCTRANLI